MKRNNLLSLTFAILILISLFLTRERSKNLLPDLGFLSQGLAASFVRTNSLSFEPLIASNNFGLSLKKQRIKPIKGFALESSPQAASILVADIDKGIDLYSYESFKLWPIASLTKLMTAVVALENFDKDGSIFISGKAVATEGRAGNLKKGESYGLIDLIKIMLLSSSNDAAVALSENSNGDFIELMNRRAGQLYMNDTFFFDPAGLSPLSRSTVSDLKKLIKYIDKNHPEILAFSREKSFKGRGNINEVVNFENFLGGKTGYIDEAKQNALNLFSINNHRILIIILGAESRIEQTEKILWALNSFFKQQES